MMYGPPARGPYIYLRKTLSLGQVSLGSWPREGPQRSDKDDVESVRDSSAAQAPHAGALLEELVRLVMGSVRVGRGHAR